MKKLELWDAHWKLKEPIKAKLAGEAFAAGMREAFFKSQGIQVEEFLKNFDAAEHERKWREKEIAYYGKYDLSILDELGLTLNDVLDLTQEKARRKRAASARPETADREKPKFIEIVIQCEGEGLNFAGTLRRLSEELKVHERTLRTWLNDLVESPNCDIPPPRRKGRG
jgi:hypothetical protein